MNGSAIHRLTQGTPSAAVFHCVKCLLKVDGWDRKCLVPLGGLLPELLECVQVVSRGVA